MPNWQDGFIRPSTLATPAKSTVPLPSPLTTRPSATITDRLHLAMLLSHHTESTLAAHLNLTRATVSYSILHPEGLHAHRLIALCTLTNADPSWILYGDAPPPLVPLSGSTVADRIAAFRQQLGLNSCSFSRSCGFASKTYTRQWETGKAHPLVSSLLRIAQTYHINAASFLPPPSLPE